MTNMPDIQNLPALLDTFTPEQRHILSAIFHHELNTLVATFPGLLAAYPLRSDALLHMSLTEALNRVKAITTMLRAAEESRE